MPMSYSIFIFEGNLKNLQCLQIQDNPLVFPPSSVLSGGTHGLLSYLQQRLVMRDYISRGGCWSHAYQNNRHNHQPLMHHPFAKPVCCQPSKRHLPSHQSDDCDVSFDSEDNSEVSNEVEGRIIAGSDFSIMSSDKNIEQEYDGEELGNCRTDSFASPFESELMKSSSDSGRDTFRSLDQPSTPTAPCLLTPNENFPTTPVQLYSDSNMIQKRKMHSVLDERVIKYCYSNELDGYSLLSSGSPRSQFSKCSSQNSEACKHIVSPVVEDNLTLIKRVQHSGLKARLIDNFQSLNLRLLDLEKDPKAESSLLKHERRSYKLDHLPKPSRLTKVSSTTFAPRNVKSLFVGPNSFSCKLPRAETSSSDCSSGLFHYKDSRFHGKRKSLHLILNAGEEIYDGGSNCTEEEESLSGDIGEGYRKQTVGHEDSGNESFGKKSVRSI